MDHHHTNTQQGHWILARMGKKVLRPGGKELTAKLIDGLNISPSDDVVEFAPGLGFTAALALRKQPKSYTGIELNEAAAALLQKNICGDNRQIIVGSAAHSSLGAESADKVYGEAMLTMQNDRQKAEIIGEAYRILRKGGYYGIHELGLTPDSLGEEMKREIQKALAQVINVNARPLTANEWAASLEKEGFEIVCVETNPMHLLEKKRVIDDEGFFSALKIGFNILTHPHERRRIKAMRDTFRRYEKHLNAIAMIAVKK